MWPRVGEYGSDYASDISLGNRRCLAPLIEEVTREMWGRVWMLITESFAMWPGSSVSGLYFAHPEWRYFGLGKIDRD